MKKYTHIIISHHGILIVVLKLRIKSRQQFVSLVYLLVCKGLVFDVSLIVEYSVLGGDEDEVPQPIVVQKGNNDYVTNTISRHKGS